MESPNSTVNAVRSAEDLRNKYPPPLDKQHWPWVPEGGLPVDFGETRHVWPKITIVLPSYNQGIFIEETIRSVILQCYPNLEFIIMDGKSTDDSVEIINRFSDEITYWTSEPDRGQSHALNKGFARSTGEIMAWLCGDDIYLPGALFKIAEHFINNPTSSLVCGNGRMMKVDGTRLPGLYNAELDVANLHNHCSIATAAAFWRRKLWDDVGGAVDEANYFTMDWELMLRMRRFTIPVHINHDIVVVRSHPNSKSSIGTRHGTQRSRERDWEVVKISRTYGGHLCFNSMAYELKQLRSLAEYFRGGPRLLYSAVFRVVYFPLSLLHRLYGKPKSNLTD